AFREALLGLGGRGASGAALVDEQHPVVGDRTLLPARWRRGGSRRLKARAALEEQQIRPIQAVGRGEFAGENGDLLAVRLRVVQRDRVGSLGEDGARDAVGGGQQWTLPSCSAATTSWAAQPPIPTARGWFKFHGTPGRVLFFICRNCVALEVYRSSIGCF